MILVCTSTRSRRPSDLRNKTRRGEKLNKKEGIPGDRKKEGGGDAPSEGVAGNEYFTSTRIKKIGGWGV